MAPLARTSGRASLITLSAWYDPELVATHATWGNCIAKTLVFPTKNGMGRRVFHFKLSLQLAYCLAKGVFPCRVKLKE